jgi:hypothetical protein
LSSDICFVQLHFDDTMKQSGCLNARNPLMVIFCQLQATR